MSSSSTYRPDPFSQPFFPTAELARQVDSRPRRRRSLWVTALLFGVLIGGTAYWLAPAIVAKTYSSAAQESYANRDEQRAISQLDKGIAWQADNLELRYLRCNYHARRGDVEKAKADLQIIEESLKPNEAKLSAGQLSLRAMLRQNCRQFRAALEDMKRSQALNQSSNPRENANAINATAYYAGLAVEFEPSTPLADEQLLLSMLAACDKAVQASGDETTIVDTRGYLHYLLGNTTQAIADFDKAIATGEKELEQGRKQIEENKRDAYSLKQVFREHEYSQAVMRLHRMKAHQKAGNSEAAKKDREAIVALGFNPELPLN